MTTHDAVRRYYGETLSASADLKTDACCDASAMPAHLRPLLARVHPEVLARYYGCGTAIPEGLAGATVLDLGCGTGRDVYLLAQLVGGGGRVIGLDMTPEQLAVARATLPWHRARFGADCPEIAFHEGLIEALDALPLAPGSVDAIVSNCVINLSPDKAAVFRGAHRLLKPGGEIHFADVYADREIPAELQEDEVLRGECLSGALTPERFAAEAAAAGFAAPRIVAARPLSIGDAEIARRLGETRFASATYRLVKLDPVPALGAPGAHMRYRGGLRGAETAFALDRQTVLPAGGAVSVDPEAAAYLGQGRLAAHFEALGPAEGRTAPTDTPFAGTPAPACCG